MTLSGYARIFSSGWSPGAVCIRLVIAGICFPGVLLTADEHDEELCGTVASPETMEAMIERHQESAQSITPRGADTFPWYIPVRIHIVRYDDGSPGSCSDNSGTLCDEDSDCSGSATCRNITESEIEQLFVSTNDFLDATDLHVKLVRYGTIDYIDDSDYAEILAYCDGDESLLCSKDSDCPSGDDPCLEEGHCAGSGDACQEGDGDCGVFGNCVEEHDLLEDINSSSGALNLYFVPRVMGWLAISSFPGEAHQGITILNAAADDDTLTHEIGHYLDLLHTHETSHGVECPDGSNCGGAGDLLCDTPADPGLKDHVDSGCDWDMLTCDSGSDEGETCNDDGDCAGSGACTDEATPPCGSDVYAPDPSNIMSYALGACRNTFSSDQTNHAEYAFVNNRTEFFDITHYVDVDAGGGGNGHPDNPFGEVQDGIDEADAGEYVFIKSGTYSESTLLITDSTANLPLKLFRWDEGGGSAVIK